MKKQKIVVLSRLKKGAISTLKSGIRLAKIMDGEVCFFCVKKPSDIIDKDSQLSAMRTINETHKLTAKKMKKIAAVAENHGVNINYSYTFGNIQNEIEDYIQMQKPDVIVLGKGKSSLFNAQNKKMIHFILKKFNGQILISDENNPLEPNSDFSFGTLIDTTNTSNQKFTELLIQDSKQPHTSFRINDAERVDQKIAISKEKSIEYVFEKGDNVIKNIVKYVSKSNINLLNLRRDKNNLKSSSKNLNELINSLNCSLIITN